MLWGAMTLSFAIVHLVPGDPVRIMLGVGDGAEGGSAATTEQIEQVRSELGLDRPVLVQYVAFLARAVTLDFGTSYSTQRPVTEVIAGATPPTLQLAALSIALSLVLGLVFALAGALLPTRWIRSLFQSVTVLGIAVPSFWVAILLLQVFSFSLGWFPAFGNDSFAALVLPAFTLALLTAGTLAQVLGRGIVESLAQPYADTARAKGASQARVVVRHALRNGSLPVFTIVGMMVGGILSGATIVETIYGRNGLGTVIVDAITARDFPLIQALVIFSGGVFVIVTLLVDLGYRYIDPRVTSPAASEVLV